MYVLGLIVLLVLNISFYYDQKQHSKNLYKADPNFFNLIMFLFFMGEIVIFTLIYLLIDETIGYFF